MIPAAGIEGIESCCSLRYGNKTRKLGIMIAPYNSKDVQNVIKFNFSDWNEASGKVFDIFWIGYSREDFSEYDDWQEVKEVEGLFYSHTLFKKVLKEIQEFDKGIKIHKKECLFLLTQYSNQKLNLHYLEKKSFQNVKDQEEIIDFVYDFIIDVKTNGNRQAVLNNVEKVVDVSTIIGAIKFFFHALECVVPYIIQRFN